MSEIEQRLKALGLVLPDASSALGNYVPYIIAGDQVFISGQVSRLADGTLLTGQLGLDPKAGGLSLEEGQRAARASGLNILAQAKAALGSLERIGRVLRLTGFVNAAPGFSDHPKVINGASDLMVEVLGDKGRHTRSALGCSGLPANAATEIDAILLIGR